VPVRVLRLRYDGGSGVVGSLEERARHGATEVSDVLPGDGSPTAVAQAT
jgi:hypothetical protein